MKLTVLALSALTLLSCSHKPKTEADLDQSSVDRYYAALKEHREPIKACYTKANAEQRPNGGFFANFIVDAKGKSSKVSITESTLKLPETENCVARVIEGIEFPSNDRGETVEIRAPFRFNPN